MPTQVAGADVGSTLGWQFTPGELDFMMERTGLSRSEIRRALRDGDPACLEALADVSLERGADPELVASVQRPAVWEDEVPPEMRELYGPPRLDPFAVSRAAPVVRWKRSVVRRVPQRRVAQRSSTRRMCSAKRRATASTNAGGDEGPAGDPPGAPRTARRQRVRDLARRRLGALRPAPLLLGVAL
jgi:hypothetical protein